MKFIRIYIVLLVFLSAKVVLSQGCSDPGICTIGTLNSETTKDSVSSIDYSEAELEELLRARFTPEKFRFELGGFYSDGDLDTKITGVNALFVARIKKKMLLNVKVPFVFTYGRLGQNSGFGDITVSFQNTFYSGKNMRLSGTMGVVIPTGNANKMDKNFVLPMAYQTTLGSFNALIGFSGAYKKWGAAIGYQHSFGSNGNEFYQEDLETNSNSLTYDSLNVYRQRFPSSKNLRRGSDLILRVERSFHLGEKFRLVLGVLPIYRINQSYITNINGEEIKIAGTNGVTLNVTGGLKFIPNKNWVVRMNFGAPVLRRKVRVDGLTRNYVGILAVAYKVW